MPASFPLVARNRTSVLLGIALILGLTQSLQPSMACPFCTAVPSTISDDLEEANCAVLARIIQVVPPSRPEDVQTLRMHVLDCLKGKPTLPEKFETLETQAGGSWKEGDRCLVLGYVSPALGPTPIWSSPTPLSEEGQTYVRQLATLGQDPLTRLIQVLPYLHCSDAIVADDAYNEFAEASIDDLRRIRDHLSRQALLERLQNDQVPPHRRRLLWVLLSIVGTRDDLVMVQSRLLAPSEKPVEPGLDAAIACYLSLGDERELRWLENHFLNPEHAEFSRAYAAITALRVHGEEIGVIPRPRLAQALARVLPRTDLADLVIADLARWERWEYRETIAKLFEKIDPATEHLKTPIIAYLKQCPDAEAAIALEQIRQRDPEAVRRAEIFASMIEFDSEEAVELGEETGDEEKPRLSQPTPPPSQPDLSQSLQPSDNRR